MRKLFYLACLCSLSFYSNAQNQIFDPKAEKFNIGFGIGHEYGGIIGGNLIFYPQKNIGLFAGGGYAFAGFGYNVGIKGRFFLKDGASVTPFVLGMYGYNAAVKVLGSSEYDKLFYGPSFGAGIDWQVGASKKNYLSFALIVPTKISDAQAYQDELDQNGIADFDRELLPVGFSIGYRIRIR
ncbi:hypothetical protein [Niabella ginsengisoli]|uniref:Outer membrane protein beta-barrel domain-containing protein n=1 Tax=Niabella ginsengisoli TaxID=522298 RepID=A0ABS9SGY9_9BACT|nr:hypothetical protein [Niabella ginsengisoli]MCH5597629.1 hypothetical protein [Niabella ginsengisoli]